MKSVNTRLETCSLQARGALPAQKTAPLEAGAPAVGRLGRDCFSRSGALAQAGAAQAAPRAQEDWGKALMGVLGGPLWNSVIEPWAKDVGTVLGGIGNAIAGWFGGGAGAEQAPAPSGGDGLVGGVAGSMRTVGRAVVDSRAEQEAAKAARGLLEREPTPEELAVWTQRCRQVGPKAFAEELAQTAEASIVRVFREEVGAPIGRQARANWLKEYENGDSIDRIQKRLHDIMKYYRL